MKNGWKDVHGFIIFVKNLVSIYTLHPKFIHISALLGLASRKTASYQKRVNYKIEDITSLPPFTGRPCQRAKACS